MRALRSILQEQGYEVIHLKLSRFIELLLEKGLVAGWDDHAVYRNRYEKLQLAGNQLRSSRATDFLAELAMAVVSNVRVQRASARGHTAESLSSATPGRVAYIIDQLKHPDEVRLLRTVYGNLFYLIGVLTSEKQRTQNLSTKLPPAQVTDVI